MNDPLINQSDMMVMINYCSSRGARVFCLNIILLKPFYMYVMSPLIHVFAKNVIMQLNNKSYIIV